MQQSQEYDSEGLGIDFGQNRMDSSRDLFVGGDIASPFVRFLVSRYIGNDWFLCKKETRRSLLDWAVKKHETEILKEKKKRWLNEKYTSIERMNGRKPLLGGEINEPDKYPCSYCTKKFRMARTLKEHLKGHIVF